MADFIVADPARIGAPKPDSVHVWALPHTRTSGRMFLRKLLGACVGCDPHALRFLQSAYGRPVLAPPHALDFNLSHSGDTALIALAHGLPELGVDLEAHRPRPRALQLAERYFAPSEHAQLTALAPEDRQAAFLRLWTAKEAVLKAHGRGLAYGLDRVVFRLLPETVQAMDFQGACAPAGAWQLHSLHACFGTACLAWRGAPRKLHLFQHAHP